MDQILSYLGIFSDYINWLIQFHLTEYAYIAAGFIFIALIILIFVRSSTMYIFPIVLMLISFILVLMILTGSAQFEWDYMLLLAFVNFAAGYILWVIISMVLSKPTL